MLACTGKPKTGPNNSTGGLSSPKNGSRSPSKTSRPPLNDRTNQPTAANVDRNSQMSAITWSTPTTRPASTSKLNSDGARSPNRSSRHGTAYSDLPSISDPGHLLTPKPNSGVARFARVGLAGSWDRVEDTPELPKGWTDQHDRAICYLDIRGYELEDAVKKLKAYFPELLGQLNEHMIDKRLRQLDQDLAITYWSDAMRDIEAVGAIANQPSHPSTLTPASPNTTDATPRTADMAVQTERTAIEHPEVLQFA